MKSLVSVGGSSEQSTSDAPVDFAALIGQLKMSMVAGVDAEFLADPEVASLEVTAPQFVILRNVLKGSAQSACELCKSLDYDRGAMSRMIDRLESKGLVRRVPLAHTRRTMALEVTTTGKAAFPKMQACVERVLARLTKGISRTALREAEKVLKRMLANA